MPLSVTSGSMFSLRCASVSWGLMLPRYAARPPTTLCGARFPKSNSRKVKSPTGTDLSVTMADFELALPSIPPSALKEFVIEVPKVSWSDVGGLDEVKRVLIENIVYAFTKRAAFRKAGLKPARGILLYGPPGTGKTILAKAVASQCAVNFISVRGPEILSKWQHESAERFGSFSPRHGKQPHASFFSMKSTR